MAPNTIRLAASLDDKVSGPLDRIRGKIDAMGKTGGGKGILGGLAAGATLGAIGLVSGAITGLVSTLGDAQAAFREDEASQSRLRASLAANVPAYNGNTDAIEKVLASRMRLGFSDDEQRASLAQLVTRTKDSAKALDLQRTAMDLARLKGISLEAATNLLGKAYSGNIGALARAGIAVDKNATATEALAAVQRAAAGQAEAFANTSEGKLAASQQRLGEAMEKVGSVMARIGDAVIPVLADAFVFLIDTVGAVAPVFESVFGIVGTVVGAAFDVVKGAVGGIIGAIRNVMDLAAQIPGPWQEGARAIAAELDGMQNSVESWGKATATGAGKAADDIVSNTAAGLAGGAGMVGDAAEEGLGDPIADGVEAGRVAAVKVASRTPQDIADALRDKRSAWQTAVDQLKDDLANKMSTAAEIAKLKGALVGENLRDGLKSKDPVVRAQAVATRDIILDRLGQLSGQTYDYGKNAMVNLIKGMTSKMLALEAAAERAAEIVSDNLRVRSPAKRGPLSRGGGPEGWGARFAELYGKGLAGSLPDIGAMLSTPNTASAPASFGSSRGGDTLNVTFQTLAVPSAAQRQELEEVLTPLVVSGLQKRRLLQKVGTF